MEETLMGLINQNVNVHENYGITEEDVIKVNEVIYCIEDTRDKTKPCAGDIIICKGPKKEYPNGHLEFWNPVKSASICVKPYTSFVNVAKSKDKCDSLPFFNTSGGYWFGIADIDVDMFEYVGKRLKTFITWGHKGPCGGGSISFKAMVNIWKIYKESIY